MNGGTIRVEPTAASIAPATINASSFLVLVVPHRIASDSCQREDATQLLRLDTFSGGRARASRCARPSGVTIESSRPRQPPKQATWIIQSASRSLTTGSLIFEPERRSCRNSRPRVKSSQALGAKCSKVPRRRFHAQSWTSAGGSDAFQRDGVSCDSSDCTEPPPRHGHSRHSILRAIDSAPHRIGNPGEALAFLQSL